MEDLNGTFQLQSPCATEPYQLSRVVMSVDDFVYMQQVCTAAEELVTEILRDLKDEKAGARAVDQLVRAVQSTK